jgi:RNA polymerase sigma-70 factor (ECF subfamily)
MSEAPGSTRYDAEALSSEQQTRFFNENLRRIFLLIYRMVGNVPDAQDLTQEAFIKALQDCTQHRHRFSAPRRAREFLRSR